MRILFQGDSITDAGRDKRNYHELGKGYPKYAAENISADFPDKNFEFINFGINGNRTGQLFDRLYPDAIAFQPDIVSVLIGINDIWHRHIEVQRVSTTNEQLILNYRCILKRLKNETNAKIVMLSPYLLDVQPHDGMREELEAVLPAIRELADEFADVFVPLDREFEKALKCQPERLYYSADGVHPNENGARFIGKLYSDAVKPLIKKF